MNPLELASAVQTWLFERIVQPALYYLGLIYWDEPAYHATEIFLYGLIEIAVLYALLRPLEAWRPVEQWSDRRATRVDALYTFLHRLGVLPLAFFALLSPLITPIESSLRWHGFVPGNLDAWIPGAAAMSLLAFIAYAVVLDFAEYVRHRLQHRWAWWWALHSLHHSQQQMSFWSDDRNHLLDDALADLWFAAIALVIGVPPGQFILIAVLMRMVESLSHANVRLRFGRVGERVLVGPHFHRVHHGVGVGHEGRAHGCNFATLLPIWDIVFRTADFRRDYPATGIRDQASGVNYGNKFWQQQRLGLVRLWAALAGKRDRAPVADAESTTSSTR